MKRLLALLTLFVLLSSAAEAAQKKVDIYVTSWCPYCRKLESFLKQNKIDFTRYDVEEDARANEEFAKMGGDGVPMARVGDEIIHGYDPARILASLKS